MAEKPIERPTLTDFLRANTAFIITPVVRVLDKLGLTPNVLTLLGLFSHVGFAYLIYQQQFRWAAIAIFFLGSLDAFDGALARYQQRQDSGFGAFLDSTCDRVAEVILFAGLLLYFQTQNTTTFVLLTYAALTGSLMVSYTRSRAEGLGFECKIGWFSRIERYGVICLGLLLNAPQMTVAVLAAGAWFTTLQRSIHVWRQSQ